MLRGSSLRVLLLLLLWVGYGYQYQHVAVRLRHAGRLNAADDASGKGFGKPKKAAVAREVVSDSAASSQSAAGGAPVETAVAAVAGGETKRDYFKDDMTRRQRQLDEKIARLQEEEALMATDPSVGAVPELVADRMLGRIVTFFGVPVFGGLAIFVGAFFYSKKYDVVVPPAMIAYATQVPFVLGLLGITYGILSSSWDKEAGSALGMKEFKTNLQRIKDGLDRSKDTANLKEEIDRESEAIESRRDMR